MRDILTEIDAGLERIRQRGGQDTIHYANLQAKREAIAGGASYRVVDVTEALIGGVGAMFATINRGSNGQSLPARGSLPALWKRFSEAAEQSAVVYPARPCQGELSRLSERGSVDMDASETLCQNPSCDRKIEQVGGGHRQRLYCSDTCRQAVFRSRRVAARRRQCAEQVQTWGSFRAETVDYLAGWLLVGNKEGARRLAALIASEQGQIAKLEQEMKEERAKFKSLLDDFMQAGKKIAKLERDVQRFERMRILKSRESMLQELMLLGGRLKYTSMTDLGISEGIDQWLNYIRGASDEDLAKAIAHGFHQADSLAMAAIEASEMRRGLRVQQALITKQEQILAQSDDAREKLLQAGQRVAKLEKQVEIQRQQLGQYYQRMYPLPLAVMEEKLLALGAEVNYKRLLKYNELTVDIGAGPEAWREFAKTADVETLALAIQQAQRFRENLQAIRAASNRDSQADND